MTAHADMNESLRTALYVKRGGVVDEPGEPAKEPPPRRVSADAGQGRDEASMPGYVEDANAFLNKALRDAKRQRD